MMRNFAKISARPWQRGVSVIAAVFLLLLMAVLAAAIANMVSTSQVNLAADIGGTRAYQAARAGAEWGVARALASNCATTTNVGTLNGMSITVTCARVANGNASEVGLNAIYAIDSTSCNLPVAGACPGAAGSRSYVERRISVVVER